MPLPKKIRVGTEPGLPLYCVLRRASDGFRFDGADGEFRNVPAAPCSFFTETSTPGIYEWTEARAAWVSGDYDLAVYSRAGVAPVPATDNYIAAYPLAVSRDRVATPYDALQGQGIILVLLESLKKALVRLAGDSFRGQVQELATALEKGRTVRGF